LRRPRLAIPRRAIRLDQYAKWTTHESDVREFFASIAFIDKVMTADGKVWRSDRRVIAQSLLAVQIVVSDSGLDPEATKEKKQTPARRCIKR
jgi:hypothetical protein